MSDPIEDVREAVQRLANAVADEPVVVNAAIVSWEAISYEDDQAAYRTHYASLMDGSPIAALGLLVAGRRLVEDDLLTPCDDDEDE